MQLILQFFLEGIMGYLFQTVAIILGMHGIAKHKLSIKNCAIASILCAVVTFFVRGSGVFNFGVHTMLTLLVLNAACIIFCKLNIRASILGSILMMILVLLSELVNVGFLAITAGADQINTLLADPMIKAASAIPGNIVLMLAALLIYRFRMRGGKKDGLSK